MYEIPIPHQEGLDLNNKKMSKTKLDYLNELALIAFDVSDKLELVKKRTEDLQRMAVLAREGKKEGLEYLELERLFSHPSVIPFDDEIQSISRLAKSLRRYKFKHKK